MILFRMLLPIEFCTYYDLVAEQTREWETKNPLVRPLLENQRQNEERFTKLGVRSKPSDSNQNPLDNMIEEFKIQRD